MKTHLLAGATLAALLSSATARADSPSAPSGASTPAGGDASAGDTPAAAAPLPPASEPAQLPSPQPVRRDRGRFSGKRLVVEMLAGAVAGSLVGVATYKAVGGDGVGAVFAGLGAQIAVTPLVAWGTGRAMGGRGTLGFTYVGGLVAFAGPSATTEQAAVSFAVGMILMPVFSAFAFELSSNMRSKRFETVAGGLSISPIADRRGISGVQAGLAFGF